MRSYSWFGLHLCLRFRTKRKTKFQSCLRIVNVFDSPEMYPNCNSFTNDLKLIAKEQIEKSAGYLISLKQLIHEVYLCGQSEDNVQRISNSIEFIAIELKKTLDLLKSVDFGKKHSEILRAQQLVANGYSIKLNLDAIQNLYEEMAEAIWTIRQQVKDFIDLCAARNMPYDDTLLKQATELLSSLVYSSLIIEKQPIQVIKKHTKFSASIRLLIGNKLPITPPKVTISLFSEHQARQLLRKKPVKAQDNAGKLSNHTGVMEYHEASRVLSASFRQLQVTGIRRASEKRRAESVAEEKCCLYFESAFTIGNDDLILNVWTLSLPIVVIVHGTQEAGAWATVTWDNAFSKYGRYPFEVPEVVTWREMANTLSTKFKSATGKELSEENLKYLGEKLFKSDQFVNSTPLYWTQLAKEHLPNKKFSFWEWFYSTMKVTKDYLSSLWQKGLLFGFVQRNSAEVQLKSCRHGTFLLRFSDSELGGVAIVWVEMDGNVYHAVPLTGKDFATEMLPDRIRDLSNKLIYLYPYNTDKDIHFGEYYTQKDISSTTINGYVKINMCSQIEEPIKLTSTSPGRCSFGTPPQEVTSTHHCRPYSMLTDDSYDFIGDFLDSNSLSNSPSFSFNDSESSILSSIQYSPE